MYIKLLPQYLINKLKAGEIVERPSSIVKELIENSLDAWANYIELEISNWWKDLIRIDDNWFWIKSDDIKLSIERYATSKISNENDLSNISYYWFRGEALASISEISKFKLKTKSKDSKIWYQLTKIWENIRITEDSFYYDHWTSILIEDIFYNTPVRKKFLKSSQTEQKYIRDVYINYCLVNYDKSFKFIKDWKVILNFKWAKDLMERIWQIFKTERFSNLTNFEYKDSQLTIYWITSTSWLTFQTQDNIKIFANNRPINDRIIKKAILDSYNRQIPWDEYPFSIIFINIDPSLLDVNVHPRKIEVKFLDPWWIYNIVKNTIIKSFSENKIIWWSIENKFVWGNNFAKNYNQEKMNIFSNISLKDTNKNISDINNIINNQWESFEFSSSDNYYNEKIDIIAWWTEFKILWQLWNSYILMENNDWIYIIDQHALAERIKYEKMKLDISKYWTKSEIILNPISHSISNNVNISELINILNDNWFDCSTFWENKIIIYAVPFIFVKYTLDLSKILDSILDLESFSLDSFVDKIYATNACKTSIKAWQKLSTLEMQNLIKEWFNFIDKMFVCQHWRPSIVKIDKIDIEKLFDR